MIIWAESRIHAAYNETVFSFYFPSQMTVHFSFSEIHENNDNDNNKRDKKCT